MCIRSDYFQKLFPVPDEFNRKIEVSLIGKKSINDSYSAKFNISVI